MRERALLDLHRIGRDLSHDGGVMLSLRSRPVNGDPADSAYGGAFDRSQVRLLRDDDLGLVAEGHCPFCRDRLDAGLCARCGQRFALTTKTEDPPCP